MHPAEEVQALQGGQVAAHRLRGDVEPVRQVDDRDAATLADEVGASLLVLGAKRRTPVGKLLLGSMVQRVLLDAQIPVLVVKASS